MAAIAVFNISQSSALPPQPASLPSLAIDRESFRCAVLLPGCTQNVVVAAAHQSLCMPGGVRFKSLDLILWLLLLLFWGFFILSRLCLRVQKI